MPTWMWVVQFSTNKDGLRKLCLPPSAIFISNDSRAFRRVGLALLQNKKTASQKSSHSFKNDGKDTYVQIYLATRDVIDPYLIVFLISIPI